MHWCRVKWLLTGYVLWRLSGLPAMAQIGAGCQAQITGQLVGQGSTGSVVPLPGATIYLREAGRGTLADAGGRFQLTHLCPGWYTVEFRFEGYSPVVSQLQVVTDQKRDTTVTLLRTNIDLQEVVVTEHRSEARQLLQVRDELTGAALNATRGLSLGESLKTITGLYTIQSGPSIAKPVIHGLYGTRILTLNNGIRQEDQQWGSEHAPQIDPFVASRLTIIKGAASIRYGSDAIGGVILVEPRAMPTQAGIGGEVSVAGVTNGRMGVGSAYLEGAFRSGWGLSWRVQGTLKRAGYARTPAYFLDNTSHREGNFSGQLHYTHRRGGIEVYYSQFATQLGLFTGAQVGSLADLYAAINRPQPLAQPGFSYSLDRPYQAIRHELMKVRTYLKSERLGTLSASVARQQNERREYDFVPFSGSLNPELYLKLVTHTGDLVWEHQPRQSAGGNWSGSVGANGITQGNVRQFLFLIPNYRQESLGGFAIERYARRRLTLEGGLRYDYRWLRAYFLDEQTATVYTRTHAWRNATGSLGAVYQLRPGLTLTANLSTAWRAPHVADLYANGLHQSAVAYEIGNPNLTPEQAYTGNLALAYAGTYLTAEVGLYSNRIQNYIYLKPDSLPIIRQRGAFPAYSYTPVDATFRGLDATLSYRFNNQLSLKSRTSLLFAYDHTNHDYLVTISPNRTTNGLRYETSRWGKLRKPYAQVSGLYVARQNRVPAVSQHTGAGRIVFTGDFAAPPPAYLLLEAEVGCSLTVWNQPLSVVISGSNLTNVLYRNYLNRFRYFADEPGRSLSLKLNVPIKLK